MFAFVLRLVTALSDRLADRSAAPSCGARVPIRRSSARRRTLHIGATLAVCLLSLAASGPSGVAHGASDTAAKGGAIERPAQPAPIELSPQVPGLSATPMDTRTALQRGMDWVSDTLDGLFGGDGSDDTGGDGPPDSVLGLQSALPDLAPLANSQFQTTVHPEENMVINGSFEMGVNGLNQTAIPGWTVTFGKVDVWSGYTRPDGSSSQVELDGSPGPGTIEQTITGLEPGQPYYFEFNYGTQGATGDQARIQVINSGGTPIINQDVTSPNGDPNTKGWEQFRQTFTAPADGIAKLHFESLNTNGNASLGFNVDDVRVAKRLTNFVVNGDFDSGPVRANATSDINGWTVTAGNVDVWNAYFRPNGSSRYLYLEGNTPGTISQTVNGLTVGQTYTLSFFYSTEGNTTEQGSVKLIDAASNTILNQTVTSPGDPNNRGWQTFRTTFVEPAGGTIKIELHGLNANGNGGLGLAVDDVRINAAPLNYVANGDFESGPAALNIASNRIPGWTVVTGPPDILNLGLLYGKGLDLNGSPGNGKLEQTVTGLTAGQVYAFQLNLVSELNTAAFAFIRLLNSSSGTIFSKRVSCDHVIAPEGWCTLRYTFTAPADGQVKVVLENDETDGNTSLGIMIDNVVISRDVNFVINGNFSSGATGLNQGSIPGWNVTEPPDVQDGYSGSEYRYAVDLNGTPSNTGLRQNLIGLAPGATYTLRYWYAATNNNVMSFKVQVVPTAGPALINLTQLTQAVQQPGNGGWREARQTFTAPADGIVSVIFQNIENDGNTSYGPLIENVSVFGQTTAAGLKVEVCDNSAPLPITKAPGGVLAGLQHWTRADKGTFKDALGTAAAAGDAIKRWTDRSGRGLDLAPLPGREPTYRAGTATSNYNPYADFLGDYIWSPMTVMTRTASVTMLGVGFKTATNGIDTILSTGNNGNDPTLDVTNLNFNPWSDASSPAFVTHTGSPITKSRPYIFDIRANNGTTNDLVAGLSGFDHANNMEILGANDTEMFRELNVGSDGGGENWDGGITENVIYNRKLSAAELQRVRSYLAIRNGITLDANPSSASVNYDYAASDGTVIWPGTATAAYQPYHNNVGGIGRDDASDLDQRKSNSVNTGSLVTMEHSAAFGADKTFLMWGSNTASVSFNTVYTPDSFVPPVPYFRMGRVWRVSRVGTPGAVTVSIPNNGANHLLIDTDGDGDFNTGTQTEVALTPSGNMKQGTATFATGDYFTFGRQATGPGGVVANLKLWVKADTIGAADGAAISQWDNQADPTYNLTQATAANQPLQYSTTASQLTNFNPSLHFDGSNDFMGNNNRLMPSTSPYTFMTIGIDEDTVAGSFRKLISSEELFDYFGLYKQGGAPGNNGWRPYGVFGSPDLGDMGKGTKYSALGGANGFWNGTNFTSDSRTDNAQPSAVGFMSQNNVANAPMFSWTDGHKENTGWSFNDDGIPPATRFFENYAVGADYNGTSGVEVWKGKINESVVYDRLLSDTEMARVNSYFGIKWGMTIGQGDGRVGQDLGYDYLASDATVIWDSASGSAYGYNVAGIGRDDDSDLNQKQSRSVNSGYQITIGHGTIAPTNADNPNEFDTDRSFLLWGDNNGALTSTGTGVPQGYERVTRIWRASESGSGGDTGPLSIAFPTAGLGISGVSASDFVLLIDPADTDFSNADQVSGSTFAGGVVTFNDVDLNNGDSFTIAVSDRDGDGVPNGSDADDDNDGIPDTAEGNGTVDTDGDGIPDSMDLDSDNDGINDVIEVNGTDANGDGMLDPCGLGAAPGVLPVNVTGVTGGIDIANINAQGTAPYNDFRINKLEGPNERVFAESTIVLDTALNIDVLVKPPAGTSQVAGGLSPIKIPAGTTVRSYLVHWDAIGGAGGNTGTITFDTPVHSLIYHVTDLNASDYLDVGANLYYAGGVRGSTEFDAITFSPDRMTVTIHQFVLGYVDELRLIFAGGNAPPPADVDQDGLMDCVDPSQGGTPLTLVNTDGDSKPDFRDVDSDNDAVSDLVEGGSGGVDADNNGVVDGPDTDGDGIQDSVDGAPGFGDAHSPALPNRDGDAQPDFRDRDSDGDGIDDIDEIGLGALDGNNDGKVDDASDSDGDGIPNSADANDASFGWLQLPAALATLDTDGDGVPDVADQDDDNDGILDVIEGTGDTDGDGVPNNLDLDSDNDGINDVIEGGAVDGDYDETIDGPDANNDGIADGTDNDGDGIVSSVDTDEGGADALIPDTDGDGVPDFLDLDSDNDAVSDLVEGGSGADDANNNGVADGPDADGDGIVDSADGDDAVFGDLDDPAPSDSDGDTHPNYQERDSDDNGIDDIDEAGKGSLDANNDGMVDDTTDPDHDGVANSADDFDTVFGGLGINATDTDGDGKPDAVDADDDNDGIPDGVEGNGVVDTDVDGVPDSRDLDSDDDGVDDVVEAGGLTDADGDGMADGPDVNGDGMVDMPATTPADGDGDTVADYRDLDSDGDGTFDIVEAGLGALDTNSDGKVNGADPDGDGIRGTADGRPGAFGDLDPDDIAHSAEGYYVDGVGTGPNGYSCSHIQYWSHQPIVEQGVFTGQPPASPANYIQAGLSNAEQGFSGDVNGDGYPDLIWIYEGGGPAGSGTAVWLSDNDGTFAHAPILDLGGFTGVLQDGQTNIIQAGQSNQESTFLADVTGDGMLDVLWIYEGSSPATSGTAVWRGNGDGTWQHTPTVDKGSFVTSPGLPGGAVIQAGRAGNESTYLVDADGDGILDVVWLYDAGGSHASSGTWTWFGNGDGTWRHLPVGDVGTFNTYIQAGDTVNEVTFITDVNVDGFPDVVYINDAAGNTANSLTWVWLGNGDGTWNHTQIEDKGMFTGLVYGGGSNYVEAGITNAESTRLADVNADGKPDIVWVYEGTSTATSGTSVWLGNGDGTWQHAVRTDRGSFIGTAPQTPANRIQAGVANVEDFYLVDTNGDHALDIVWVVEGSANGGTAVWLADCGTDTDHDGITDTTDADDDNDGIPDTVEGDGAVDTDGDGIPDSHDLDSDNDGVNDVDEAGGLTDANGDGFADGARGANGMIASPANAPADSDSAGGPDYRDLDSDGDGTFDIVEAGLGALDTDSDGKVNGTDTDGDGILGGADERPSIFGDRDPSITEHSSEGYYVDGVGAGPNGASCPTAQNWSHQPIVEQGVFTGQPGGSPPNYIQAGLSNAEQGFSGDVNGDGHPDLIWIYEGGGPAGSGTAVWLSDNDGTFAHAPILDLGGFTGVLQDGQTNIIQAGQSNQESTFLADVTGDGMLDVLWIYEGSSPATSGTAVWRGNGDGTWQHTPTVDKGSFVTSPGLPGGAVIQAGRAGNESTYLVDVNDDGILDVVWLYDAGGSHPSSGTWTWLGNGDGTWQHTPVGDVGNFVGYVQAGDTINEVTFITDVNTDGKPDIVYIYDAAGNPANSLTWVWLGNGDGTWNHTKVADQGLFTGLVYGALSNYVEAGISNAETTRLVDVNNDAIPDIVWVYEGTSTATSGTSVWLGNGDGTWNHAVRTDRGSFTGTAPQTPANRIQAGVANVEDFYLFDANGDNSLDIVWVVEGSANGGTAVWLGDCGIDTDHDGVGDSSDADDDDDGIPDTVEGNGSVDTDGDGVPDSRDLDSDNDGVNDVDEAGGLTDANGDGRADGVHGPNGMIASPQNSPVDTDGTGGPDYRDLDSDGDGTFDVVEAGLGALDTDGDGKVNGTDPDGDGILGGADGRPAVFGDRSDRALPSVGNNDLHDGILPLSQPLNPTGCFNDKLWKRAAVRTTGFTGGPGNIFTPGYSPNETTHMADVDNDGILDIVWLWDANIANPAAAGVYIWKGHGDGTFDTAVTKQVGTFTGNGAPNGVGLLGLGGVQPLESTHVADVNNDGNVDLIWLYESTNSTYTWLGHGDGTFDNAAVYKTGYTGGPGAGAISPGYDANESTHLVDANNDGNLDVLWLFDAHQTNPAAAGVYIWLGVGDGTWQTAAVRQLGTFMGNGVQNGTGQVGMGGGTPTESTHVADFNGDGNVDLLWMNEATNKSYTWLGNGDGTFQNTAVYKTGYSGGPGNVLSIGQSPNETTHIVDVDNDGKLDVVWTWDANVTVPTAGVYIWRGLGDGTFATAAITDLGTLTSNGTSNGSGTVALGGQTNVESSHIVDLNGDGAVDLLWLYESTNTAHAWLSKDTDGDGHADTADADDDNDGIPDTVEGAPCGTDTDNDGVPDSVDLDSDNDGINDVREAGGLTDANGDGKADGPIGRDGMIAGPQNAPVDTDGDGVKDFRDLDSDNDSVTDIVEGGQAGIIDHNGNGVADGPDADGDGIVDSADGNDAAFGDQADPAPLNSDATGAPDYLDLDSDDDGLLDIVEAGNGALDANHDGRVDDATDDDGDGIANPVDTNDNLFGLDFPKPPSVGNNDLHDGILPLSQPLNPTGCFNDKLWKRAAVRTTGFTGGPGNIFTPGVSPNETTHMADVDNDGDLDIVWLWDANITNPAAAGVYIWKGHGDGTFDTAVTKQVGLFTGNGAPNGVGLLGLGGVQPLESTHVADVNNDGNVDLIWLYESTNSTYTWLGHGDGTFQNAAVYKTGYTGGPGAGAVSPGYDIHESTHLADVNNDGNLDIVWPFDAHQTNPAAAGVYMWLGVGDGTWQTAATTQLGDFTGNSVLNGTGAVGLGGADPSESTHVADFNGDGNVDLLWMHEPTNKSYTWLGNGDGTFQTAAVYKTGYTGGAGNVLSIGMSPNETTHIVDVDNDGKLDVVWTWDANVTVPTAGVYIWRGLGDGTFATAAITDLGTLTSNAVSNGSGSVALGGQTPFESSHIVDLNGDGAVDLLWLYENTNTAHAWLSKDTDGDGVADIADADDDNDGIPDSVEGAPCGKDSDGDGVPDSVDLDSDNDGINDVREAGGLTDANGDGKADGTDANGDGMIDGFASSPVDTDGDGAPDYRDLDSDNDALSDLNEGGQPGIVDANNNGVADGPDADGDGIVDSADGNDAAFGDQADPAPSNPDGDGAPSYIDRDSDGDGADDIDEIGLGALDANNDGKIDNAADADGDGAADNIDTNDALFGGLPFPPTPPTDTDGDGVPDASDLDDDNDGIPDTVEGSGLVDTDGDGHPDSLDLDSDNDGINDVREAGGLLDANGDGKADGAIGPNGMIGSPANSPVDTDGDGKADFRDLDADNDGVSDLVEGGQPGVIDVDNNGVADGPDADGDGIVDSVDGNDALFGDQADPVPSNPDADGTPSYRDRDSDNNGIDDIDEAGYGALDANNDGRIDNTADPEGDGIPNILDNDDTHFGGEPNPSGDDDGDGIPNSVEGNGFTDTDGDGVPDSQDADSDNDGIPDLTEGAGDQDGDGHPNFRDLDSDNDGINDVREAGGLTDANGDGKADGTDGDGDGMIDTPQANPVDTDGDGVRDYLDLDSDNDGVSDLVEGGQPGIADANNDGVADGPDADGDGIVDSADGNDALFGDSADPAPANPDGDGLPSYRDRDSDGDGADDIDEAGLGALDANNDGRIDNPTDPEGDG
ncbi:MAG: FG-GAP-like repeat-containing protein, partial [Ardenticatenales bacterium]